MKTKRSKYINLLISALLSIFLVNGICEPVWSAEPKLKGIRGTFVDFIDDPWKHVGHDEDAARFYKDGLLVIDNGIIKAFGPYSEVAAKYPALKVTDLTGGRIIVPGFVDGHVHFPQTRVIGEYGLQLLPWLTDWIIPEEMKYKDDVYAREGITHYFDNMLSAGTTTVQDYGTSYASAVEIFFDEASKRNMRVICGIAGIDRNVPAGFVTPPEQFYAESKRLIEKYHRKGRNLYSIVPRFAYGASPDLMTKCQMLHKEFPDCWINTHVSENPTETRDAAATFGCADYLGCYEKYDLVGPKFTAGHGVWLSNDEFRRLSEAGASVSFCPNSNTFLGSGLFRLGAATDPNRRVRLIFGSDMGAGEKFCMLNVLDQAYKVGMCNNTELDGSLNPRWHNDAEAERNKLNAYRAFYSLTLGGAQGLYLDDVIGNFNPGKEADFVVLDWNAGPPCVAWRQSLICDKPTPANIKQVGELLFGVMGCGDDRCVDETWVMGNRLYKRSESMTAQKKPLSTAAKGTGIN